MKKIIKSASQEKNPSNIQGVLFIIYYYYYYYLFFLIMRSPSQHPNIQGILFICVFIIYLFIYLFNHEIAKPAPKPQYGVTSVLPWGIYVYLSPLASVMFWSFRRTDAFNPTYTK